ncbi:Na-translocating system protein MpsC family protein [Halanaerobium saccharolyticum]|uniref:Na-translocating system protein MpsC family protein n=1 Tax=Halanaerobium saccharolyticum TaxID=43595 RepID=UPI003FCE629F
MNKYTALNHELSKLYKNISGKGPKYLKTYAVENILIVKINWYPEKIFTNFNDDHGQQIIKKAYKYIFEYWGQKARCIIEKRLKLKVTDFYYDENMALSENEKIIIFLLDQKIE